MSHSEADLKEAKELLDEIRNVNTNLTPHDEYELASDDLEREELVIKFLAKRGEIERAATVEACTKLFDDPNLLSVNAEEVVRRIRSIAQTDVLAESIRQVIFHLSDELRLSHELGQPETSSQSPEAFILTLVSDLRAQLAAAEKRQAEAVAELADMEWNKEG